VEGMEEDGDSDSDDVIRVPEPNEDLTKLLKYKVYKRRWFLLLVICILNSSNSMLWLSFAPVADQTAQFFHATLDQINWLSLVYMVVAIPVSFGTTWMLDTLGLRMSLILSSWLNMSGSILRLVSILGVTPYTLGNYPMLMGGQSLCALAQPLVIFSPTKMAALWFPEHQRATANMLASMSNPLGILLANIISPLIVKDKNEIPLLLGIYTIPASIVCLLATLGIRESVPPTPPSASAEISSSEPFFAGINLLLKNKAYMILLLCFGCGIAIFTCFSTLLEQMLCVKGYSNEFAGLCGALFIVFGILGAFVFGMYVDRTKNFIEVTKINMCLSSLACIVFAVVSQMEQQSYAVAAVCSLFGLFGFSVYPIAMELSVESSYPVGEATSAGLIFISGQIQSIVFIIVLQLLTKPLADLPYSACALGDNSALSWKVPALVMAALCCVGTCYFVIFFHTEYKRLKAEEAVFEGNGNELEDEAVNEGESGVTSTDNQSPRL
uniref:Solute carrier family 49 member 3 n=2 Tax=Lepisosteus oculatus TaxID=7918 RepID=W5MTM4_LEPOC